MDKYEYKVRADEIKQRIAEGNYQQAAEIADTIDWRRVKSVMMLCTISDLYKINRRYEDAKNMLLLAYERRPGGKTICYSLCELCIKTEEFLQAVNYYKEFVQVAPKDSGRYILQYKLYEAQDVSLEERIGVLEELKKRDYREKWAYELAYLYHRVGLATRCVEECDELILWFGEGKYVIKAMELKMLHQPLSPSQQEKYDHRFDPVHPPMAEMPEEAAGGVENEAAWGAQEQSVSAGSDWEMQGESGGESYYGEEASVGGAVYGNMDAAADRETAVQAEQGDFGQEAAAADYSGWAAQGTEVSTDTRTDWVLSTPQRDIREKVVSPAVQQPAQEELDIQVKTVDVGAYNTINLQAEIAAGLQEVLAEDNTQTDAITRSIIAPMLESDTESLDFPEIDEVDEDDLEPQDEVMESSEVFFGETGELSAVQKEERMINVASGEAGSVPEEPAALGTIAGEKATVAGTVMEESAATGAVMEESVVASSAMEESAAAGTVMEESAAAGAVMKESVVAGTVMRESAATGSVMKESAVASSVMKESAAAGTVMEESAAAGAVMKESAAAETVMKESAATGSVMKESVAAGTVMRESAVAGSVIENSSAVEAAGAGAVPKGMEELHSDDTAKIVMDQLRLEMSRSVDPVLTAQPPRELAGVLSQESDGQIRLVVPESETVEKQITGQMNFEEILDEWEKLKRENEAKRQEEVRQHVLEQTGNMFTEFEASLKDGLLEKLESEPVRPDEDYLEELELIDVGGEAASDQVENKLEKKSPEKPQKSGESRNADSEETASSLEDTDFDSEDAELGLEETDFDSEDAELGLKDTDSDSEDTELGLEDTDSDSEDAELSLEETASSAGTEESGDSGDGESGSQETKSGSEEAASDLEEDESEKESPEGTEESGDSGDKKSVSEKDKPDPKETVSDSEKNGTEKESSEKSKAAGKDGKPVSAKAAKKPSGTPLGKETEKNKSKKTPVGKAGAGAKGFTRPGATGFTRREKPKIRALTREEKELYAPFIQSRSGRENLVKAIDNISMAAYTGNVIITGEKGMDTLSLAKNMIREIQMIDSNFSGKAAQVSGQGLNSKNVEETLGNLSSGALIIHEASEMEASTVEALQKVLQKENFGIIVFLEDTKKAMERFLAAYPKLRECFTARMDVEAMSNDQLVAFGRKYARELEYTIDELGVLALHTRVEERQTLDHVVTAMEVKDIVDEAIRHANKKTLGHFFDILFARRYDEEDMIILTEKDFV